jgi:hypothetical protein
MPPMSITGSHLFKSVLVLLRKVQKTITSMPMKHLGVSVFGRHHCLINARAGRITGASYGGLITEKHKASYYFISNPMISTFF